MPDMDQNGNQFWLNALGQFHRVGGPAVISVTGRSEWWLDGQLHREDGPAYASDGYKDWEAAGKPPIRTLGGLYGFSRVIHHFCEWYAHGKLHRVGGPAVEHSTGYKAWYHRGALHNLHGPACIFVDKRHVFFVHGVQLSEDHFYRFVDHDTGEVFVPPGRLSNQSYNTMRV